MKRVFPCLALLLAGWALDGFAQDKPEKKDKSERREEKRDEKREKSERSEKTAAPQEPMTKSAGYEGFANVRTKNIFDPNRRGPRIETPPTSDGSSSSRGRSLALTGTMVTDGKELAFFGGSAADGNRVISVGHSVASYKVTAIAATQVALEHEGKSIVLEVGRQISFEGAPGDPAAAGPIVEAAAPSPAETTGLPSLPPGSGDKSELLRRMMERRAKEGGQ